LWILQPLQTLRGRRCIGAQLSGVNKQHRSLQLSSRVSASEPSATEQEKEAQKKYETSCGVPLHLLFHLLSASYIAPTQFYMSPRVGYDSGCTQRPQGTSPSPLWGSRCTSIVPGVPRSQNANPNHRTQGVFTTMAARNSSAKTYLTLPSKVVQAKKPYGSLDGLTCILSVGMTINPTTLAH